MLVHSAPPINTVSHLHRRAVAVATAMPSCRVQRETCHPMIFRTNLSSPRTYSILLNLQISTRILDHSTSTFMKMTPLPSLIRCANILPRGGPRCNLPIGSTFIRPSIGAYCARNKKDTYLKCLELAHLGDCLGTLPPPRMVSPVCTGCNKRLFGGEANCQVLHPELQTIPSLLLLQ